MQRRGGHGSAGGGGTPSTWVSPSLGGPRAGQFSRRGGARRFKFNPVLVLVGLAFLVLFVSWYLFPKKVLQVEHELAEKAIRAEHDVENWLHHPSPGQAKETSEEASARMQAQSSKWVDGEKALKRQLAVLAEKQQKGELLGVPVLTRYLGEDFPAWVTPEMDEAQWRKQVADKYAEMRREEEEWKTEMQKIIDQRERDIGITTAR